MFDRESEGRFGGEFGAMKVGLARWAVVGLFIAWVALVMSSVWWNVGVVRASQTQRVTWKEQIAPLVYKNCTNCHHVGGSGPFSLMTYADARRWGGLMKTVTASRFG